MTCMACWVRNWLAGIGHHDKHKHTLHPAWLVRSLSQHSKTIHTQSRIRTSHEKLRYDEKLLLYDMCIPLCGRYWCDPTANHAERQPK